MVHCKMDTFVGIFFLFLAAYPVQSSYYRNYASSNTHASPGKTDRPFRHSRAQYSCEDIHAEPRMVAAIMGGKPVTDKASVPYMAAVGERRHTGEFLWFCGGVLLTDRLVLTAAHCLAKTPDAVRLGGLSLHPNASSEDVAVESFTVHPQYKAPQTYHDVALLHLATSVRFTKNVRPICWAHSNAGRQPGEVVSVMGWGADSVGGMGNERLQKVQVQIFSNAECNRVYSASSLANSSFPRGITAEQLCAGVPEGGKDACRGDSGGPLVVENRDHVIRLLGIVAAGDGCGVKHVPGVYIRVSSYEAWIKQNL